jgi:hypothetical protein
MLDVYGFDKENTNTLVTEGVKVVSEKIAGMMTVAFVAKTDRNVLYISKKDNPVTIAYVPYFDLICFASQSEFVANALDYAVMALYHAKMIGRELASEIYNNTKSFDPKEGSIYRFDATQALGEQYYQDATRFEAEDDYHWGYGYSSGRGRSGKTLSRISDSCGLSPSNGILEAEKRVLIQRYISGDDDLTDVERALIQDYLVV